jgi:hypothetical protein
MSEDLDQTLSLMCWILRSGPPARLRRRAILVRSFPGAIYDAHINEDGAGECLILDGAVTMGDLRQYASDFRTVQGCLLYLSMAFLPYFPPP